MKNFSIFREPNKVNVKLNYKYLYNKFLFMIKFRLVKQNLEKGSKNLKTEIVQEVCDKKLKYLISKKKFNIFF